MAATAELGGDFVDVHVVALGAQADARQFGSNSSKTQATTTGAMARMWSMSPSVSLLSAAGAGKVGLLEPEIGDLVLVGQAEVAVDVAEQTRAGEG